MSTNSQYYCLYTRKILDAASEYIITRELPPFLNHFYVSPESEHGQLIVSILRESNLLFDESFKDQMIQIDPDYVPSCCICNTKSYTPWKLVGITPELQCRIVKLILPSLLCEKCFRKRFCYQTQMPFLCGVAVFPPLNYAPLEQFNDIGVQNPTPSLPPPNPQSPVMSSPSPTPSPSESLSSTVSPPVESPSTPSERSYLVPVRQSGLFRSWVTSLVIIEKGVMRRYIGKTRNEKKVELVNLSDCTASHSTLNSDVKRPYCVIVQPGPSNQSNSSLLLSFSSRNEEQEFLTQLKEFGCSVC